jgi:hypothetical protein
MIDKLLIPHFTHIDTDSDVEVRKAVVEIIINMAQGCSKDEFFDLINIIEKVRHLGILSKQFFACGIHTGQSAKLSHPTHLLV